MKDHELEGQQDRQARRVRLDWSRMLGFDQVGRESAGPEERIGARAGIKPGVVSLPVGDRLGPRIGAKPGFKPMTISARIGARIGAKPGFKPMT